MLTYPLFQVHINKEHALKNIEHVFNTGFINEGQQVTILNSKLSQILNSDNLSLYNSCTSAITVALKLAGVTHNSFVLSTPMTCVATNTPVINSGANLVWYDIEPNTGMPSIENIKSVIESVKYKITALLIVAWAGSPPNDLKKIYEYCKSKNIKMIIDAAHAFDARYDNQQIHEFSDYTCYSFQAIKHFTTGDGGALVCKNYDDHLRSKKLKWFGYDRDIVKTAEGNWKGQQWDADLSEAGYKFNMNNVAAAIGLSQIDHINDIISKHRNNALKISNFIKDNNIHKINPVNISDACVSSRWVYTVIVKDKIRDTLICNLKNNGIDAGIVHVPNNRYEAFKFAINDNLPGLEEFSSSQFSIPCGWWLNDDHLSTMCELIKKVCNEI